VVARAGGGGVEGGVSGEEEGERSYRADRGQGIARSEERRGCWYVVYPVEGEELEMWMRRSEKYSLRHCGG